MPAAGKAEPPRPAAEGSGPPGTPIGPLTGVVAALCDDVLADVSDLALRETLLEIRARLGEPLRIAIAGSVSSGKSTLVNALLGRAVAPVDASDCTRVVTSFRFGFPERVELVGADGARRVAPLGSGEPLAVAAGDLEGVAELVVWLSNERLRELTLIDTPGLDSIDPERDPADAARAPLRRRAAGALPLALPGHRAVRRQCGGRALEDRPAGPRRRGSVAGGPRARRAG
jgi:hypothetical protein